ncbi:hypothetical protein LSH36_448g02009 [Paralvinella palmiformis]|uniref:Aquaporin n=1 Tax=Paralvinella palmiformis TaxID=53620 RepID=A0AAD9JAI2_9ANNE|nr:hypothetical protein LSH36_448g02009 [Paralvinella palmiformis]
MNAKQYRKALSTEWRYAAFYRDLLAEFVGTFMLVSVQVALPLTWGKENMGTVVQVALFMGFIVGTMAWTMGDFSGGHFNPAVTFSMVLLGKITIIRGIAYIAIQSAAGLAGASWVYLITPRNHTDTLAATMLHPDMKPWQGFLVELWITMILVLTILGATNDLRKRPLYMPPIMIGMAISLGIASGFNSTGGSMNPARSLGPAAAMEIFFPENSINFFENHWVRLCNFSLNGVRPVPKRLLLTAMVRQSSLHPFGDTLCRSPAEGPSPPSRLQPKAKVYWAGPLAGGAVAALIYGAMLDLIDRPYEVSEDVQIPPQYDNPSFSNDKL